MRLFVLTRHAQSVLNLESRINGDPARPAHLTELGREQVGTLGVQLRSLPLAECVYTRFARTLETAEIALENREIPMRVEPLLDDIDVGELEGSSIANYRDWKRAHARSDPFPGGESLEDAARRYTAAFLSLLEHPADVTLVVCHEIPVRYALNAAAGSADLDVPVHDIPNAVPFLFDETSLLEAAERLAS